jgi:hypothetical protein
MRRSVYKQPGTRVDGSYRSKEGFQVSKRESARGDKKQGEIKSKGKAPMYSKPKCVHNDCV